MVKVADVCPAGTITFAGTAATPGTLLVRVTVASAAGGRLSVTVPVAVAEPVTLVGLTVSDAAATPTQLLVVTGREESG